MSCMDLLFSLKFLGTFIVQELIVILCILILSSTFKSSIIWLQTILLQKITWLTSPPWLSSQFCWLTISMKVPVCIPVASNVALCSLLNYCWKNCFFKVLLCLAFLKPSLFFLFFSCLCFYFSFWSLLNFFAIFNIVFPSLSSFIIFISILRL